MHGIVTIKDEFSEKKYIPLENYQEAVDRITKKWMLKHILDLIESSNKSKFYHKDNPYFKANNDLKRTITGFLEEPESTTK